MFPLNFNFPFRKSNGELTTLGRMFENSGGGDSYTLPTANAETKGGIKVGSGLTMDGETLNNNNPTPYTLPTASASTKGGVKVGSGLTMDGETLNNNNPTPYTLPTASASTKGGVKVGTGLDIDGGVLYNKNLVFTRNETPVGVWIDGKIIYRKVIEHSYTSPLESVLVDSILTSTYISDIIDSYGATQTRTPSGSYYKSNLTYADPTSSNPNTKAIYAAPGGLYLSDKNNAVGESCRARIVILYTKN